METRGQYAVTESEIGPVPIPVGQEMRECRKCGREFLAPVGSQYVNCDLCRHVKKKAGTRRVHKK